MTIRKAQVLAGRMSPWRWLACALLALLAMGGPALRAARKEAWLEVRSPHFIAYGDASEREAREVLRGFEAMRSVFSAVLPGIQVDLHKPMIILVSRDAESMRRFVPRQFEGKDPKRPSGLFWQGQERNYALVRMDVNLQDDQPFFVVFHEYTHCVVHQNFPELPTWIDEGIADFYGATQVRAKDVFLGRVPLSHIHVLRGARIPLEDLLTVTHDSPYYQEGSKANIFYAQSWALVHYLFLDEQARKAGLFGRYLRALDRETDPLSAARATFGDMKKLEGQVARYGTKSVFSYWTLPLKIDLAGGDLPVRPVDEAEALAVQAEFLLHSGQIEAGAALAGQAKGLAPGQAAVQTAWGMACLRQGRDEEAQAAFARALELGSQDFRVPYHLARLSQGAHAGTQPDTVQVEAWLRRGLVLQPDFPGLHLALGRELARRPGEQEHAVREGLEAVKLSPNDPALRLNFGSLLVSLGRIQEAEEIGRQAARVAPSQPDRDMVRSYQEHLAKLRDQLAAKPVAPPPAAEESPATPSPSGPVAVKGAKPLKFWLPDSLSALAGQVQMAILEGRLDDAIQMVQAALPKARGQYEKPSLKSLLQALKARKAGH